MLLLFWNGSGTTTGAVKISPMKNTVSVSGGAVSVKPLGKVGL